MKYKIGAHNNSMLWAGILNFKFRIVFWNIFFWRFGLSEKNPPLLALDFQTFLRPWNQMTHGSADFFGSPIVLGLYTAFFEK